MWNRGAHLESVRVRHIVCGGDHVFVKHIFFDHVKARVVLGEHLKIVVGSGEGHVQTTVVL